MATQAQRDALAKQLRAQYDTGQGGSGSWDDAGHDRALELADLLLAQGVTDLGEMSWAEETPWSQEVTADHGDSGSRTETITGINRKLKIGDKTVGFLGDANNDGSYSGGDEYLKGQGDEALLGWSARGKGNTSYRVIKDPATGKLVIAPGWNSSSDADTARNIAIGTAAVAGAAFTGGGSLAAMGGGAGTGAAVGAGAAAGAGAATTMGLTAAQWAAIGSSMASGAMTAGAANAIGQLRANGWDLDEVELKETAKAAVKGAAVGGVTQGVGMAANAAGASPTVSKLAASGARTAMNGGDVGDFAKGALLNVASSGANDYLKTEYGLDPSTRNAIVGAGRSLITGGGTDGALTSAALGYVDGIGRTDAPARAPSDTRSTPMSYTYNDDDWGETIDYSQFTGGGSSDEEYNGLDFGGGGLPFADYSNEGRNYGPGGFDASEDGPLAAFNDGPGFGDYIKDGLKWLFGGSGGSGGSGPSSSSPWLRDILGLIGNGMNQMNVEKMAKDNREWVDKKDADRRRRQMPVGVLPRMAWQVNKGGPPKPVTASTDPTRRTAG